VLLYGQAVENILEKCSREEEQFENRKRGFLGATFKTEKHNSRHCLVFILPPISLICQIQPQVVTTVNLAVLVVSCYLPASELFDDPTPPK